MLLFLACEREEGGPYLSLCWGVDDVIYWGRRGENGHISSFEMLDPVAELGPIQTRHHYGVDQLPWEERGEDNVCHSVHSLSGMCYSQIVILGIKSAHSWRVMLCDASRFMEKAMHKNVH